MIQNIIKLNYSKYKIKYLLTIVKLLFEIYMKDWTDYQIKNLLWQNMLYNLFFRFLSNYKVDNIIFYVMAVIW